MITDGAAWSTEEKRLRLWRGDPLKFNAPPDDGTETPDARSARTIPAALLEELAARPARAVGVPIKISNAIVEGPLDLTYATFAYGVTITDSEFTGEVDLSFATFQRVVELDGARFQGKTRFRAAHAAYDFLVKRAHFADETSFAALRVDQDLDASGARFDKDANFDAINVDGIARFSDELGSRAQFGGKATFLMARIKGDAEFMGVQFAGDATFERVEVGGAAFFRGDSQGNPVRFGGKVDLRDAHIRVVAEFMGAQFAGDADFEGVQVDGTAFFGPDATGNPVRFSGAANFLGAHIGGNAEFIGAQFAGDADFEGVQVDGTAFFRPGATDNPVHFSGAANFAGARIKDQTQYTGAQFDRAATFDGIDSEGLAIFGFAHFMGVASFSRARFAEGVSFKGSQFDGDADFTAAVAERDVDFSGAIFSRNAIFFVARFRVARFRGELIDKPLDTAEATFAGTADLRGFTYERIDVAWEELLQRLDPYDRQPYTQLETVLRTTGKDHEADQVYLARRASERKRLWQEWKRRPFDVLPALLDFLNWVVPHYGVRPLRLLVFTILLLAFGVVVFSSPNAVTPRTVTRSVVDTSGPQMVILRKEEPTTLGNPLEALGVSLNVLLPLELPAGGDWQPSDCYVRIGDTGDCHAPPTIAITYAFYGTLQRLLGWVVVPLGIAALTGLLSRRPAGGSEQRGAGGEG